MKNLTDAHCGALPKGDYEDLTVRGLRLRVGARTRTWEVRIKRNGVRKAHTLGCYPMLSLGDARKNALAMIGAADEGMPVDKLATVLAKPAEKTLGELLTEYEQMRRRKKLRIKSLDTTMRMLRLYLVDDLDKPFKQFTKARIRELRNAISGGRHKASRKVGPDRLPKGAPVASNRFLGCLSPILTWAASEEIEGLEYNPVRGMHRDGSSKPRDRVLTDEEIRAVWAACEGTPADNRAGASYARLVRFLLATGQRKSEGSSIYHGHVLDGVWIQDGNKSDRTHWLKLPGTALDALGQGEARALAFEGKIEGQPIAGFSKLHVDLVKRAGTAWWTLHDLRRTASTRLEGMMEGSRRLFDDSTIHALLNHGKQGLKKNYFHDALYEPKAQALAAWDAELRRILKTAPRLTVVKGGS